MSKDLEYMSSDLLWKEVSNMMKNAKVKKEKTPKIVCKIDQELIEFKNEKELKQYMWKERPNEVIRYNLDGKVSVPFELNTEKVK